MLNQKHAEWLEGRGLDVELLARLGVSSHGDRIAVPYPSYVKAFDPRDKSNTRCLPAGIEQTELWNEASLLEAPEDPREMLIITEGEWDAMACLMTGADYVVSLPSGTADNPEGCAAKARRVIAVGDKLKPHVAKFSRVLIMTDGDMPGVMMRDALVDLLGAAYCYLPKYPEGTKDANDVLRKHGLSGLTSLIADAVPAKSDGFIPITDVTDDSTVRQLRVGIPGLDQHLILSKPEFMVVGGESGHGKSTVLQIILYNLLKANPSLKASIFHGEGHRSIVRKRAMIWWKHAFGCHETMGDPEVQRRRDAWLGSRVAFISPPPLQPPTFDWLLWAMERHALHRQRDILVVDPWNEILHSRDMRKSMTDHIGECIIKMKALADRLGLILIVSHHVTKPRERLRPPMRYDLADSAHWVNKADHVVLVWKPSEGVNKVRVEVAKSKDHQLLGVPGYAYFSLNTSKFSLDHLPHECDEF